LSAMTPMRDAASIDAAVARDSTVDTLASFAQSPKPTLHSLYHTRSGQTQLVKDAPSGVVAGDPAHRAAPRGRRATPVDPLACRFNVSGSCMGGILGEEPGELAVEDVSAIERQLPLEVPRRLDLYAGLTVLVNREALLDRLGEVFVQTMEVAPKELGFRRVVIGRE